MTRAQEMVGLLLPQADRAADVSADLRVAENAADLPVLARRRNPDGVRIHPNHDDRGLGLLNLVFGTVEILQICRLGIDQLSDLDVLRLERFESDVLNDANARRPNGPLDGLGTLLFGRPWA